VTPEGRPDQARFTAEAKTPWWVTVALAWTVPPAVTLSELCAAARVKLEADSVTAMGTVAEKPPAVAFTDRL
jgi:hypothetical protein